MLTPRKEARFAEWLLLVDPIGLSYKNNSSSYKLYSTSILSECIINKPRGLGVSPEIVVVQYCVYIFIRSILKSRSIQLINRMNQQGMAI